MIIIMRLKCATPLKPGREIKAEKNIKDVKDQDHYPIREKKEAFQ